MTVVRVGAAATYMGLAGDTKPTSGVAPGARFLETDTDTWFIFTGVAWDEDTSAGGGGGGGGAVTIANGADVAEGATGDALVAAGATGSLSAKLRRVTQGLEDLKSLIVLASGANLIGAVRSHLDSSTLYSGTTALTPKFATITASASGNTAVVAAVSTKKLRVVRLSVVANAAVNVKFQSATNDKTGLYYLAANGGWVEPFCVAGLFETNASEALNINLSGNVAVGGCLTYLEI